MINQKPTLNLLSYNVDGEREFKVVSTKDTTRYYPGEYLSERELKEIVRGRTLTVNIKEVQG